MQDSKYCYPNSNVLINKLNITDAGILYDAEKELTTIRLRELQDNPIQGDFDFKHLKDIHHFIFQDLYEWAGKERTVEIGKGNLFCTTACIQSYASSVFSKYYKQCIENKGNKEAFVKVFADNYGDLNALHPFREGNGRSQREFARLVCLECGYIFDLSNTTHVKMLEASKLSFDKADNSLLCEIFKDAIIPIDEYQSEDENILRILTSDDLFIKEEHNYYDYYSYDENLDKINYYSERYEEKINEINNK